MTFEGRTGLLDIVPVLAEHGSAQGSRQGKLVLGSSLPNPEVGFQYLPCSVIAKRHTNPSVTIDKTLAEALMGKLATDGSPVTTHRHKGPWNGTTGRTPAKIQG